MMLCRLPLSSHHGGSKGIMADVRVNIQVNKLSLVAVDSRRRGNLCEQACATLPRTRVTHVPERGWGLGILIKLCSTVKSGLNDVFSTK